MTRKGTIEKGSRTALVTGAGSGIGRCMARRLAELGYRLILAGLDPAKLEAAAEELHEQYGLAVEVIPIDLARPEAAHELSSGYRLSAVKSMSWSITPELSRSATFCKHPSSGSKESSASMP